MGEHYQRPMPYSFFVGYFKRGFHLNNSVLYCHSPWSLWGTKNWGRSSISARLVRTYFQDIFPYKEDYHRTSSLLSWEKLSPHENLELCMLSIYNMLIIVDGGN